MCASYHWLDEKEEVVSFEGLRTLLPAVGIEPGEAALVDMELFLPETDGDYQLEITLVQEFFTWFESIGLKTGRLSVRVSDNSLMWLSENGHFS